jgi:hypothetical protein
MAESEANDRLDRLLDSFLAHYSAVDPRPGFTMRLESTLREHAAWDGLDRRRRFWIAAGAAVAVGAVALLMIMTRPVEPPRFRPAQADARPRSPGLGLLRVDAAHPRGGSGKRRFRGPAAEAQPLPADHRPELFPTPSPLSEQEQLLARYMATTPREELIAQSRPDQDSTAEEENSMPDDLTRIREQSSNARQGENL